MIVFYIFSGLILLMLLLAAIGAFLKGTHEVTVQKRFQASKNSIYELITCFDAGSRWRESLIEVEVTDSDPAHYCWREIYRKGRVLEFELKKKTPDKIVTEIINNRNFGGRWIYKLEGNDRYCDLSITEKGKIRNPVFKCFAVFMDKEQSVKNYLQELEKAVA